MGAVFLDLDGTLSDSGQPISAAVAYALQQVGLPVPDAATLRHYIGPPLIETFTALKAPDPSVALEHYRVYYTDGAMLDAPVYDGMFAALEQMRQAGHRLYVMTAKPHVYAQRITAHLGLTAYMTGEYGPELDGTYNDKAELLARALIETGETAENSVMVGDRTNDLRAGHANKMAVIGALWGFGDSEELAEAEILLEHPAGLPAAVEALIGEKVT